MSHPYYSHRRVANSARPADDVSHPSHYTHGGIECIDAIEAWQLDFHRGNAIKYIMRARHKGTELKDLMKARWYLDRAIRRLSNGADEK